MCDFFVDFLDVGIERQIGDIDIYVEYKSKTFFKFDKHELALYIHFGTSMRRFFLIGEENGNGAIIVNDGQNHLRELKPNECLAGVYGTLHGHPKGKRFDLSLVRKEDVTLFWHTLYEYGDLSKFD